MSLLNKCCFNASYFKWKTTLRLNCSCQNYSLDCNNQSLELVHEWWISLESNSNEIFPQSKNWEFKKIYCLEFVSLHMNVPAAIHKRKFQFGWKKLEKVQLCWKISTFGNTFLFHSLQRFIEELLVEAFGCVFMSTVMMKLYSKVYSAIMK